MAKISVLEELAQADGTELIPVVKGGRTRRMVMSALALAMVPFLQAYYKGDKGNPGAAGNVAYGIPQLKSRPVTEGDVWQLNAGKRSGTFRVREASFVPPASDPYQGLYIHADNGLWFERHVKFGMYSLDWWQPSNAGDSQQIVTSTIDALLPSGATLMWGSNIVRVKSVNGIRANTIFTKPITVIGNGPDNSRLELFRQGAPGSVATEYQLGTDGLLQFRAGNVTVRDMGFFGEIINQNSNDAACVDFYSQLDVPFKNVLVEGCRFENCATAVLTRGTGRANPGDNPTTVGQGAEGFFNPVTNVVVRNNEMFIVKYALLCFATNGATFQNNTVRPHPGSVHEYPTAHGWRTSVRVCGVKGFKMLDNDVEMPVYDLQYITTTMIKLDNMSYGPGYRCFNSTVQVHNNRYRGGGAMYEFANYRLLNASGNVWEADPTADVKRPVIVANPTNDASNLFRYGTAVLKNETYIGASSLYACDVGLAPANMGTLTMENPTLVLNRYTGGFPENALVKATYPAMKYYAFKRLSVLGPPRGTYDFRMIYHGGLTLVLEDCILAEQLAGGLIETNNPINTTAPDSLTVVASIGSKVFSPADFPTYRRQPAGLYEKLYPLAA